MARKAVSKTKVPTTTVTIGSKTLAGEDLLARFGEAVRGRTLAARLSYAAMRTMAEMAAGGMSQRDIASKVNAPGWSQSTISRSTDIIALMDAGKIVTPDVDDHGLISEKDGDALLSLRGLWGRAATKERVDVTLDNAQAPMTAHGVVAAAEAPKARKRAMDAATKGKGIELDKWLRMQAGAAIKRAEQEDMDVDELLAMIADAVDQRLNEEDADADADAA